MDARLAHGEAAWELNVRKSSRGVGRKAWFARRGRSLAEAGPFFIPPHPAASAPWFVGFRARLPLAAARFPQASRGFPMALAGRLRGA
jgi:hypothetical protein